MKGKALPDHILISVVYMENSYTFASPFDYDSILWYAQKWTAMMTMMVMMIRSSFVWHKMMERGKEVGSPTLHLLF